jgi:ferrochelatase
MNKIGVLLINLGTPDNCEPMAVYRYLTEFLNDPRVVDLPQLIRWFLINCIIVPFRYQKSVHAYQKIWTKEGSPLLINSVKVKNALAAELGNEYQIEIAMRYGKPTIQSALKNLQQCDRLIALPMFPQYSSAATGSAIAKLLNELAKQNNIPEIKIIRDFYNHPGYINAYADIIKKNLAYSSPEIILFSYHGLPENHINKSNCQAICNRSDPCPSITTNNLYCYRAQCYATSHLLASALNLTDTQYHVSFQSRLGHTPWIKPYTDLLLPRLYQKGIRKIAVACPSFTADCLETLEEVNIRLREQWLSVGGTEFNFIPCLNDHPLWAKAIANIIES